MKQKTLVFVLLLSSSIVFFLLLTSFFNTQSFRNSFLETAAKDNATVAQSVVGQLEYTLKYGKTLDNYYGIESVFEELRQYLRYADELYITDMTGTILYNDLPGKKKLFVSEELPNQLLKLEALEKEGIWKEGNKQFLLLPIQNGKAGDIIAALCLNYDLDTLGSSVDTYVEQIYGCVFISALTGVILFLALFYTVRKNPDKRSFSRIIIPSILLSNLIFGILAYGIFKDGYLEITHNTAEIYNVKIQYDIRRVVSQGVAYEELYNMEDYFDDILGATGQIDSIELNLMEEDISKAEGDKYYELPADRTGRTARLVMSISKGYISSRLRGLLLSVAVSVITSLMIAGEVISFLLDVLTVDREKRGKTVPLKTDRIFQPIGIVRGLSFFFAMFQYMAMAFVSTVLASIYRPVVIFQYTIPYEIVMGLPLSIQIITSLLTAWLSGKFIVRCGWKPIAVGGIFIMSVGTVVAAIAWEPYMFLLSQVIIGIGLGFSKTSFDVYAVLIAPDEEMERYTANANAGITMGMSCSSALGAVIAAAVGYSGAYLVMGAIGCGVALLVILLGINVTETRKKGAEKTRHTGTEFDLRFFGYLMFMVLPYYFIMMFVDYFFPVYANAQGMSMEMIGYVFLAYGMCTSYLGVFLCNVLVKKFSCSVLMTTFLGFTGIGILLFSLRNVFFFSIVLVLVIAVSDGVMPSQQFKYLYSLPFSKRAGFTRAVSIEGIFGSSIRGVAPIIFGYVMLKGNAGLLTVAVLLLVSAVVFSVINRICAIREGKKGA